jgi:type II secretory pathway pseudopilin PulG
MLGRQALRRRQAGALLLAMLLFILVSSLAASSLFVSQGTQARREKEEQLLFVGDQFRKALVSYYNTVPPGGGRSLPRSLDDLLADHRFPTPVQHLRRLYLDPMTGKADWRLVVENGQVLGVASASTLAPIKTSGFARPYEGFGGARTYSDWVFRVQ